jgi:hypothetical protein
MRLVRQEIVAFALSWLLCALVVLHVYRPGDLILGNGDSVSHFGHVLLFARYGFDVYKRPSKGFCHARDTPEAHAYAKASNVPDCDICEATGATGTRPFFVNWQDFPQPYPPGSLLYSAPEAWLFAHTNASLGVCYLSRKRGADALLALSIAVFLHYRALWYAPLFAVALLQVWKGRDSESDRVAFAKKLVLRVAGAGTGPRPLDVDESKGAIANHRDANALAPPCASRCVTKRHTFSPSLPRLRTKQASDLLLQ